ncbi:MAG: HAD family hydrolase [Clostridia bacterium]|nr:HAD family hydrolase [Clostridia bacterium]
MSESPVRLAVFDMDGTLLNSEHRIGERTCRALSAAAEAGCLVAISSGRALSQLDEYLPLVPFVRYLMLENGAHVYDLREKRSLTKMTLGKPLLDRIIDICDKYDAACETFIEGHSHIACRDSRDLPHFHLEHFTEVFDTASNYTPTLVADCREKDLGLMKINFYFHDINDRETCAEELKDMPVTLARSIALSLEITGTNVNKGAGLLKLCELLAIDPQSVMAVGDSGNDLEMLKVSGYPVAMGNASDDLKAVAKWIAPHCDDDGAGVAVEHFILDRIRRG